MAKARNSKTSFWYGYLSAGARSSPVLRDADLDTGNPKTFYMFNLVRGEIIEYAREIVEAKLRDLKPAESKTKKALDAGYKKARATFKGRHATIRYIADRGVIKSDEDAEFADNSEIILDDADIWASAE